MMLSVVVPVHNEKGVLQRLFNELSTVLTSLGMDYQVVFVDDGSSDGSWEVICSLQSQNPGKIVGVKFTRNFGKEAAIYAGLKASRGDLVVVMDADLQHPPHLISEMLDVYLKKKTPIVEAVKIHRQKEGVFRRMGAVLFYRLFKRTSGIEIDKATDFKLLERRVVDAYLSLGERVRFFRGLTAWTGFSSTEIPFEPPGRLDGEDSRWSLRRLLSFAVDSIVSFSSAPLRMVTYLGVFTLLGSLVLGVQTLWVKLSGDAVPGFTTVILVELILGSVLMIALGLIGEYLARIYEEVKARPLYVVEEWLNGEDENQWQREGGA